MITIIVELGSRKLGGSMLLLPFDDEWLGSNTCRDMLQHVLVRHLDRPIVLATAEIVKRFYTKQEVVTESGLTFRLEKEIANATTCLDMHVIRGIKAFSTFSFSFKITSLPITAPSRP